MNIETWNNHKPNPDTWVKIVYLHRGEKYTEERLKFKKETEGKAFLDTENWARDFFMIPIKNILYIKPIA